MPRPGLSVRNRQHAVQHKSGTRGASARHGWRLYLLRAPDPRVCLAPPKLESRMKCIVKIGRVAAAMSVACICGFFLRPAVAADWPMLGRDGTRNSVSPEVGAPTQWSLAERNGDRVIHPARGIRWSAPL